MKKIISNGNPEDLVKELDLVMNEDSPYVLVENNQNAVPNAINVVFDPANPKQAKELLVLAGYYKKIQRRHLIGRAQDEVHILSYDQILYIEGVDNDTFATTKNKEYRVKEKLYELESLLAPFKFIRISKSYIVSIMRIAKIKPTFQGKLILIMDNQQKLEVTRHYLPSFKQYLGM